MNKKVSLRIIKKHLRMKVNPKQNKIRKTGEGHVIKKETEVQELKESTMRKVNNTKHIRQLITKTS